MRVRVLLLCTMMCIALVGCGKKSTEYELAKQNESALSNKEQQYLEKYWYGSWQKYYKDTGEFDEQEHVIDENLYDGSGTYVIHSVSMEYGTIEYELFDLDTGKSEGIWADTISVDDNIETLYTEWRDVQFGGMTSSILVRRIKE